MNGTRIVRVLAPNPSVHTLEGTNTWVLGRYPAVVIDPGPDDPGHLSEVRRTAGEVGAIMLTHMHPDHAPGSASLAEATSAPVYAFRPPDGGERLRDGESVRVGELILTCVHTPGHTPDHVAFHLPGASGLFTGDAVLGRGTSVIDPPEGDLAAYLRSLNRMRDLGAGTIYPGHGPVVFDARAKLDEYIEHRAEREREVVGALARGSRSIDELVEEIYGSYPQEVRPLAARTVLAHLKKLEGEGRASHTGRGRSMKYAAEEPRSCRRCGRPVRGRASLCDRCRLTALQEQPQREKR